MDQELKNQCGIPLWISNSIFCCLYWIIMSIECSPPFYELWCLPVLSVPLFITTTNDDGHYQNRIENGMKHFRVTLILGHVILKDQKWHETLLSYFNTRSCNVQKWMDNIMYFSELKRFGDEFLVESKFVLGFKNLLIDVKFVNRFSADAQEMYCLTKRQLISEWLTFSNLHNSYLYLVMLLYLDYQTTWMKRLKNFACYIP